MLMKRLIREIRFRNEIDYSIAIDITVFIPGQNAVFLWVGRGSNLNEKKEAFHRAAAYVADASHGLPSNTPISRVSEGNGSRTIFTAFEESFSAISHL